MAKTSRRKFIAGAANAVLMAHGAAAYAEPAAPGPASGVVSGDDIRALLRQRIEVEKRSVGMAVCVVAPGRASAVTWGRERLGDNRPVADDTVFEIGSITKIFTALLLADMARRGEIALDDPLSRHLPADFHVPEINGRQITLTDLATHTSGLPRFPALPGTPLSPEWIAAISAYTLDDLKTWLAGLQPEPIPPDAGGWWYSNVGYTLLAMALEHRAATPYPRLLRNRVLDPMGLRDTVFQPSASMAPRVAESHDAGLNAIAPTGLGIFIGGGGLLSTPRDLSRFAAKILSGSHSRFVRDEQMLLSVQRPAPWIGGKQALGWEVRDAAGGAFVSKDGVTWGQAASMVFDPATRTAVIAFSNTAPDMRNATLSGGGVGTADLAQHLLRPEIPLAGGGGRYY